MSNKNKQHSKKWLISRLKTSGSKKRWTNSLDYADDRNTKSRKKPVDELPMREGMGRSREFYNGKINYGLLVRFLRNKVGTDWDEIYSEYIQRVPDKLMDYKDFIYWFVADKVEFKDGKIWNLRAQKFIITEKGEEWAYRKNMYIDFYVDPHTNQLVRIPDIPSNRKTKKMSKEELRAFRENEKRLKLKRKEQKRKEEEKSREMLDEINDREGT